MEVFSGLRSSDSGAQVRSGLALLCGIIYFIFFVMFLVFAFTIPKMWTTETPHVLGKKQALPFPSLVVCPSPFDGPQMGATGNLTVACTFNGYKMSKKIPVKSLKAKIADTEGVNRTVGCQLVQTSKLWDTDKEMPTEAGPGVATALTPDVYMACNFKHNNQHIYVNPMVYEEIEEKWEAQYYFFTALQSGYKYGAALTADYLRFTNANTLGPFYDATYINVGPSSKGFTHQLTFRFDFIGSQTYVEYKPMNFIGFLIGLGGLGAAMYGMYTCVLGAIARFGLKQRALAGDAGTYDNL